MKNLIKFIFPALIIFFGCKEKDTIEVIPNYDEIYLPVSEVDSSPKLIEGNEKELSDRINKEIKKSKIEGIVKLDYKLLVDENGNVNKVEVVESPDKSFTNLAVKQFENWQFKPGMKNGKNVKSQYRWYFNINKFNSKMNNTDPKDFLSEVEQMPEPIGGMKAIQEKVHYPEIAKKAGIEGKVFIKAFIDENGNVVNAEVIKGVGTGLDEAAQSAIMNTKFKPAIQNGKKVKVQIVIPIAFQLS